ncbi:hypothetical protein ACI2LD_13520 [Enterococcus casseliflavus]|uniref:hypothetical protein n=1 Tax=Enterococcus TaxID=1350 RepID=UPI0035DC5CF0
MNIKGAPFRAKLLKGFLVLWVACSFPITSFSNELRSTETDGTVQFTGVYEPLDPPVPSPPTGPVPRPPQDTVKPGGELPQTNTVQRLDWVILGGLLLIIALDLYMLKQIIRKGKVASPDWG